MIIDAHAHGRRFCGGWAHAGMSRAARWLKRELEDVLHMLASADYSLVLVGHSLGASRRSRHAWLTIYFVECAVRVALRRPEMRSRSLQLPCRDRAS
eukprot:291373-Pleurochrysis_carterae.AAC.2